MQKFDGILPEVALQQSDFAEQQVKKQDSDDDDVVINDSDEGNDAPDVVETDLVVKIQPPLMKIQSKELA